MNATPKIEEHPLGFFLPENAGILMLGSFPPKKERWSMNFYYPNFQNDMWRIMGLVFYGNKEHFVINQEKRAINQCPSIISKANKTEIESQRKSGQIKTTQKENITKKGASKFNESLIRKFCIEKGIALGDIAVKVKRLKDNASDKFLEIVETLDIENILEQIPHCHTIIVTGEKAMETLISALNGNRNINSLLEQANGNNKEITAPKVGEYTIISFPTAQTAQQSIENRSSQRETQQTTFQNNIGITRQIKLYRMPSSSRAYPKSIEEKAAYYQKALTAQKALI